MTESFIGQRPSLHHPCRASWTKPGHALFLLFALWLMVVCVPSPARADDGWSELKIQPSTEDENKWGFITWSAGSGWKLSVTEDECSPESLCEARELRLQRGDEPTRTFSSDGVFSPTWFHRAWGSVWENGDWRITRAGFSQGGLGLEGGFITWLVIVEDLKTKQWSALKIERAYDDSGHWRPTSVKDGVDLRMTNDRADFNCWEEGVWTIRRTSKGPAMTRTKTQYRWMNDSDTAVSVADNPKDGRHWGMEEVAWSVRRTDASGGVAFAVSDSPRAARAKERGETIDLGPLYPTAREVTFQWKKSVPAIEYGETIPTNISIARARTLISQGWKVILEQKEDRIVVIRVIESRKAFPHYGSK